MKYISIIYNVEEEEQTKAIYKFNMKIEGTRIDNDTRNEWGVDTSSYPQALPWSRIYTYYLTALTEI